MTPYRPGNVLGAKYRVDRILGVGGLGVVVQGWHLQIDEPVALKILFQEACAIPGVRERFHAEVRALAKGRDPVVRVLDVGETPDGVLYSVMGLPNATQVAALLERCGAVPVVDG